MSLIVQLQDAQKDAMRAKDKVRLGTIRLVLAAVKQAEIDGQTTLTDTDITALLNKQVKQRRDAIAQYQQAGRQDLADNEAAEIAVLEAFLPQPLSEAEIAALIEQCIAETGAASIQDLGKVMGLLKAQAQGRADLSALSGVVKARLTAAKTRRIVPRRTLSLARIASFCAS